MKWMLSYRADPSGRVLADRHYNRQKVGAAQFVPPAGCVVLLTEDLGALWVTSTPVAEYVKHAWPGAWVNSTFRNERPDLHRSSALIIEALAATRAVLGDPPPLGMVTFIDATKVRRKRDPGRCFRKAGFVPCEPPTTKAGLIALQCWPGAFPAPAQPIGYQLGLVGT
jgi:hypothetical protein